MADKINQIEIGGLTYDLQDKKSIFTGTAAEYEAVADTIEDGTVVNITDDLEDGTLIGVEITNKIESLENELEKTNTKVDTIIEKADLGIKENASGESIHLDDSADYKLAEFALYGKARQNTTNGNQLANLPDMEETTVNGLTWFCKNGIVIVNGTPISGDSSQSISLYYDFPIVAGSYFISGSTINVSVFIQLENANGDIRYIGDLGFTLDGTERKCRVYCQIRNTSIGVAINDTVYPMLNKGETALPWEPYTGGISSPNPDYPQDIEVAGESYNLLEIINYSSSVKGVEFIVNDNGSVSAKGTAEGVQTFDIPITLEKGSYKASIGFNGNTNGAGFQVYRKSDSYFFLNENDPDGSKFTIEEETLCTFRLRIGNGATVDTLFKPMIRKASVKNDRYMPYGKGSVETKSVGKNLFKNTFTSRVYGGITFVVKDDGSIEGNGTCSEAGITTPIGDFKLPKGKYIISGSNVDNSGLYLKLRYAETDTLIQNIFKDAVFEVDDETVIYRLSLSAISNMTLNSSNNKLYPMIRLATDTDGTYEPYKEIVSTIPTDGIAGIPVDSDGNYTDQSGQQWICDEIVKNVDGSGEFVQRVGKTILNGSEGITWTINDDGIRVAVYCQPNALWDKHDASKKYDTNILCNYLIGDLFSSGINRIYFDNNWLNMAFDIGYVTSSDEFNEWLTNNNLEFWYELATPIITDLSAEEVAEIEKLSTFYLVTNISNDFDCGMKVKYNVDAKSYIDKKIAEMIAAKG